MQTYRYNKQQMLQVISSWGVIAELPKKGKKTIVAWPAPTVLDLAEITVDENKTTYGKTMYKVVMTSKADREKTHDHQTVHA